jgi:hypothetical protein
MKAALALLLLAPQAFADQERTLIPAFSILPIVITTPGAVAKGSIQNWGSLSTEKGSMSEANERVVQALQQRECTIAISVTQDDKSGRFHPANGLGKLSCLTQDGSRIEVDMGGTLIDKAGKQGMSSNAEGDQAFFLVERGERV